MMGEVELSDDPRGEDPENPTKNVNVSSSSESSAGVGHPSSFNKRKLVIAILALAAVAGVTVGVLYGSSGNGPEVVHGAVPASVKGQGKNSDRTKNNGNKSSEMKENDNVSKKSKPNRKKYSRTKGPLKAKVKKINRSVANGYESCVDLQNDIAEALKYYADEVIMDQSVNSAVYEFCDPNNPNWYWEYYGYDYYGYGPGYDYDYDAGIDDFSSEQDKSVQKSMKQSGNPSMTHNANNDGNKAHTKGSENIHDRQGKNPSGPPNLKAQKTGAKKGPGNKKSSRSGGIKEDSFYSNNQVDGIDSADVIKSDGTHVFAAYGGVIYAWEGSSGANAGVSKTFVTAEPTNYCSDYYYSYGYGYGYDYESMSFVDESGLLDEEQKRENPPSQQKKRPQNPGKRRAEQRARQHFAHQSRKTAGQGTCTYVSKPRVQSMLVHGDRLTAIVTQDTYDYSYYDPDYNYPLVSDYSILTVQVFNIKNVPMDGSPLKQVGYKEINGDFYAGRSSGSNVVLATTTYIDAYSMTADLYRYNDQYCGLNAADYIVKAGETATLIDFDALAKEIVDGLQLQDDCSNIFQISTMQDSGAEPGVGGNVLSDFVSIITFDMSENFGRRSIVPTQASGAFAPNGSYPWSLYVTDDFVATINAGYSYDSITGVGSYTTYVLGFDTSSGVARPSCFGGVPGYAAHEYAVNKYNDYLQIATVGYTASWENINTVYILTIPQGDKSNMEVIGESENLGENYESITAARFFGETAYIVTSYDDSPFIIMDLSDPKNPTAVGKLRVPGYSTYLHPVDFDSKNYVLAIGEDWDSTSWSSSARLTLFDVSDPSSPTKAAEFLDPNAYTNAMYDFQSIRYLPDNKVLIIPLVKYSLDNYDNTFDGSVVYSIDDDEIKPLFNITQKDTNCWYDASIPARSVVFDSEITIIKGHTVVNTDMDGNKNWEYDLDEGLGYSTCSDWWY